MYGQTRHFFIIQHILRYKKYKLLKWWFRRPELFGSTNMHRWQRGRMVRITTVGKFRLKLVKDKNFNKHRKD